MSFTAPFSDQRLTFNAVFGIGELEGGPDAEMVDAVLEGAAALAEGEFAPLARIGFSGSVKTIHLHYQLQSGPAYADEGVPSYFTGVRRVGASHATRIDTGDIVEAR